MAARLIEITLVAGGPRAAVQDQEAAEMRNRWEAQMAAPNVVVRGLDLSGKQWTIQVLHILMPALRQVAPTLHFLSLADTIAGNQTEQGLKVLTAWNSLFHASYELRVLDVSANALGSRGIEQLVDLLSLPRLNKLGLRECGLSAETIPVISQAFARGGNGAAGRFQALVFDQNSIEDGAEAVGTLLSEAGQLNEFSYKDCRANEEEVTRPLADGLNALAMSFPNHGLQSLKFGSCTFGDFESFALHSLCFALKGFRHLRIFDIQDSAVLGQKGTALVVKALIASGCELHHLGLSKKSID
jgi:Ran GTPase-activating protein (RanGAP) involved in mRNA processing and transport